MAVATHTCKLWLAPEQGSNGLQNAMCTPSEGLQTLQQGCTPPVAPDSGRAKQLMHDSKQCAREHKEEHKESMQALRQGSIPHMKHLQGLEDTNVPVHAVV
eukprot:scaffold146864_cov22-Tisochrysis_lutea.AAC.3